MKFFGIFSIIFIIGFSIVCADEYNEENSSFELPADWANIRSNIDTSFSCVGRSYGYYADVYNDCQLYHVCNPRVENGETLYTHNPFICSLGTVFDQRSQTCIHQTPDFSCAESVQHYGETESRYADVHPVNEVSNVVNVPVNEVSDVVSSPIVNEVVNSPPVNEHVVSQPMNVEIVPNNPIFSPIERPSVTPNNSPVVSSVVEPVAAPVVTESSQTVFRSSNVHHSVPLSNSVSSSLPVVNEVTAAPVVAPVVSSNVHVPQPEHSEVVDVHPVSNVVHHSPIENRLSSQNHVVLVEPRKGPTKSVNFVARQVPVINVSKSSRVQQQVVRAPVAQPQKTVRVQQQVPVAQQAVVPIAQPQKTVRVQQQVPVVQQAVVPVAQPQKTVRVQQQVPVVQQAVAPVAQPQKTVRVQQQVVEVPRKTVRARPVVSQQVVEVPRKNVGPINQESVRAHVPQHVYLNNQPTWQYHYLSLYPHLVHNNPYHRVLRQSVRYVN